MATCGAVWICCGRTAVECGVSEPPGRLVIDSGGLLGSDGRPHCSTTRLSVDNQCVLDHTEQVGSVTDIVHEAYRVLCVVYQAVGADREVDPSKRVRLELESPDDSAQARARLALADFLNEIIGHTATRIGEHLSALRTLYQPSPRAVRRDHPFVQEAENRRSPRSASFTVARGILEGVSMFAWVSDSKVSHTEWLRRTASVSIWSAHYADRANGTSTKADAIKTANTANIGQIPRFTQTGVVEDSLGDFGTKLYGAWSGRAHHAPWAGLPGLLQTDHGDAVTYSAALEQPAHIELATDVTILIRIHLDCMVEMHGKRRTRAVDELVTLEAYLRRASDVARAAVAEQQAVD